MTRLQNLRGFYAVIDRDDEALARALVTGAGACALQVRMKRATTAELYRATVTARRATAEAGAALVVDDRLDVALAAGADAVHLGQDDLPLAEARAVIARCAGAGGLRVGISTHDPDQVEAAVRGGADYLGFGPVFATRTKQDPDPVQGVAGLREAVRRAGEVPVVAIGGITAERAPQVAAAGALAACCIGAVSAAPDPAAAGRRIAAAWA